MWKEHGLVGVQTPTIDEDITANCYTFKSDHISIVPKYYKKEGYCTQDETNRNDNEASITLRTETTIQECLTKCEADKKCRSAEWIVDNTT